MISIRSLTLAPSVSRGRQSGDAAHRASDHRPQHLEGRLREVRGRSKAGRGPRSASSPTSRRRPLHLRRVGLRLHRRSGSLQDVFGHQGLGLWSGLAGASRRGEGAGPNRGKHRRVAGVEPGPYTRSIRASSTSGCLVGHIGRDARGAVNWGAAVVREEGRSGVCAADGCAGPIYRRCLCTGAGLRCIGRCFRRRRSRRTPPRCLSRRCASPGCPSASLQGCPRQSRRLRTV